MPSVVLDASMLVGALLKPGSAPERALLLAYGRDRICMSEAVAEEVRSVFGRPKFAAAVEPARIGLILDLLMSAAHWFVPTQARGGLPRHEGQQVPGTGSSSRC